MPVILRKEMSEKEILRHVAEAYADVANYVGYDVDYENGLMKERKAWVQRDFGIYAGCALKLIEEKENGKQTYRF